MSNKEFSPHEQMGRLAYEAWLLVFKGFNGAKWGDLSEESQMSWCFIAGAVAAGMHDLFREEADE